MTTAKALRPGGRSARVQQAVHRAVREIQQEGGRESLTVPAIAARAGVTHSTIYRRWGDLAQLLSDVAAENLRPESPPPDTGTLRGDLELWLVQYFEEMSSMVGRTMLRDVLNNPDPLNAGACARCIKEQFDVIGDRAAKRGERAPTSEVLMDHVVAPLIYRILFSAEIPEFAFAKTLLDRVLRVAPQPSELSL